MSYEAFSRTKAMEHLSALGNSLQALAMTADLEPAGQILRQASQPEGIPVAPMIAVRQRPGTVSPADPLKVANDFILLGSTRQSLQEFLHLIDMAPLRARFNLDYLAAGQRILIVSAPAVGEGAEGTLLIYDDQMRKRLELQIDSSRGYQCRAAREMPAAGLHVLSAWQPTDNGRELEKLEPQAERLKCLPT